MSKPVKEMLIADIRNRIGDARDMLVIDSARLDAISTNKFRLALREKSISALTVRNSLAKRALNEIGLTALDSVLDGPSTLVWGDEDIIALSKEISKWAKELAPLEIKGGALEGSALSAADVEDLSKSPSREELIGQIVGMLLNPGARLAAALLAPGGRLAGQLESLAEPREE
jgi:large subunit ribosomal protein L10